MSNRYQPFHYLIPSDEKRPCDPAEIALKSFFLGPQAENSQWLKEMVLSLLED